MSSLPSYREATTRPDWLRLASSYVWASDYWALCLVDRHFWSVFAPRLWRDLFASVRRAGLDPGDDIEWWFDFVFARLGHVRPATRSLVRVLDARHFAQDTYHFTYENEDRTLRQSLKRALELLPDADIILFDGHVDLDAGFLTETSEAGPPHWPRLLSTAHCATRLPNALFASPSMQRLVYLDISGVPGSVRQLIHPGSMPSLRILKLRARELDDAALDILARHFRLQLWSLDLASNKLTDNAVDVLVDRCFSVLSLRSNAHFQIEGRLAVSSQGSTEAGPFSVIEESEWSGSFRHPERYLVDPPMYMADAGSGPQEYEAFRSDGGCPAQQDSADEAIRILSGGQGSVAAEAYERSRGLSHLCLSGNQVSAVGVEKLVRVSNGRLQSFSCDTLPWMPPAKANQTNWPKSARLRGILGASHVFRPVFSSDLRTLRIHHSLVTNVPTLEMDGLSRLARDYLSETCILARADEAFPQCFVPDMNPRLSSLTLTCIPRRSSGPLASRLMEFLKLLSVQEQEIEKAKGVMAASSWRSPGCLPGLRHLRLEFGPDPTQDGYADAEELDAEDLMYSGDAGFSFFDDGFRVSNGGSPRKSQAPPLRADSSGSVGVASATRSEREHGESVTYDGVWKGEKFSVPVWAGPTRPAPNSFLHHYRRLVLERKVQTGVGPASPGQVKAGAPQGSFVFQTAWRAAVMPSELNPPSKSQLSGMVDVLCELRTSRLAGRARYLAMKKQAGASPVALGAPHFFWTGKLEVSTEAERSQMRAANYWR